LLKRELEQNGVVLEEIEPVAGNLATRLEVEQVERLAELDVVHRLEVEGARRADAADLAALVLGRADGSVRMGEVGDTRECLLELGFALTEAFLETRDAFLVDAPLFDQLRSPRGVLRAAGLLRDLVLNAPNFLELREGLGVFSVLDDERI